jgi:hypothetical protein
MTDFSTASLLKSASNYPISKGDVPGHDFHGNQWTSASGTIRSGALSTLKAVRGGNDAGSAGEHSNHGLAHSEVASSMKVALDSGRVPSNKVEATQKAMEAHRAASDWHHMAAAANSKAAVQSVNTNTSRNTMNTLKNNATEASENASYASAHADEMTKDI